MRVEGNPNDVGTSGLARITMMERPPMMITMMLMAGIGWVLALLMMSE